VTWWARLGNHSLTGASHPYPFDDLNEGHPVQEDADKNEYQGEGTCEVEEPGQGKQADDQCGIADAEQEESPSRER